jgi:PAS domain S-box-containing protein
MGRIPTWVIAATVGVLAVGAALTLGIAHYGKVLEERRLRDLAMTAAASLDPGDVAELAASESYGYADAATFKRVRGALARVRQAVPEARFAYLIAKRDGEWRFLADAEPPDSSDYSPPGQVYADDAGGFETVLARNAPFVEPIARDQWGVWVSGEAPVRDPATGRTLAVLGLDVHAGQWLERVALYRWVGVGISLLIVAIALLFAIGRLLQDRSLRRLAALETRNRLVMDTAAVGLLTADERGVVRSANPEAERIFGYAEAEVRDSDVSLLIPDAASGEHGGDVGGYLASLAGTADRTPREMSGRRRDGSGFPLELNVREMSTAGRTAYVASIQDVSRRKESEEALRQAQKMETLGQLTGGVAHDFNNMLLAAQLNLEVVEEHVGDRREARECLRAAQGALKRGAELTDRLLAFSRRQPLQPRVTNVNLLVAETLRLLQRTLQSSIAVRTSLAGDIWPVEVDQNQLTNALVNLAVNARDAMSHGGTLTIETSNVQLDEDYVARQAELAPGEYTLIAIGDTGAGMTPEVLGRAFEPFFTTKPFGQGSGLGLSMVYGFVKQSGGHVTLYSEPGRGTTVKMYFPRSLALHAPAARPPEPAPPPPAARGETILLVEDDGDVRASIGRLLSGFGYRVHASASGPEALRLVEDGLCPNLILADVVLPEGMSGPEIAEAVTERVPACRRLFMSGYTADALIHDGRIDADVVLLSKPFPSGPLAEKIREVLDAPPGGAP